MGYHVRKGERAHIRIWARCEPSKKRLQAWKDAGAIHPRGIHRLVFVAGCPS